MYSSELLKGTLSTLILKLLDDNGRLYGYEITQRVKDLTQSRIQLTEGALYPALHKLEAEGLLATETEYIGKRVRKYYRLTDLGKQAASDKVAEFADFVRTVLGVLNPKPGPQLGFVTP
ncbi:MAG: helix-turn-helix transcriptional regulator [Bacteroidia bacterium]|nr:helix-turn-helix transcriptional regulator [Bacteroidia bacterium]